MADDIKVTGERDPYELYRTPTLDPNDPDMTSQLKMNPIFGDSGEPLNLPGHITSEQLADVADRSRHMENGPKGFTHSETIREMLHRRGVDTPAPRGRKYFT